MATNKREEDTTNWFELAQELRVGVLVSCGAGMFEVWLMGGWVCRTDEHTSVGLRTCYTREDLIGCESHPLNHTISSIWLFFHLNLVIIYPSGVVCWRRLSVK